MPTDIANIGAVSCNQAGVGGEGFCPEERRSGKGRWGAEGGKVHGCVREKE